MVDAAYFLEKAEQCFRLSRAVEGKTEIAAELKDMGNDFMAKAVYFDTMCKRAAS